MKHLNERLFKESKEVEYRVAFLANKEDGTPINATILIDQEDIKDFEKYLQDEQDNIFAHAEGGNIEEY